MHRYEDVYIGIYKKGALKERYILLGGFFLISRLSRSIILTMKCGAFSNMQELRLGSERRWGHMRISKLGSALLRLRFRWREINRLFYRAVLARKRLHAFPISEMPKLGASTDWICPI